MLLECLKPLAHSSSLSAAGSLVGKIAARARQMHGLVLLMVKRGLLVRRLAAS